MPYTIFDFSCNSCATGNFQEMEKIQFISKAHLRAILKYSHRYVQYAAENKVY